LAAEVARRCPGATGDLVVAWRGHDQPEIVPGLIDVVMISNLLIMVIVGGYETFVSRRERRAPASTRTASCGRW
jgi:hypothetical protein